MFNVNDDACDAESAPVEMGTAIPRVSNASGTDVNNRNSKHYLDATTDQLLGLSGRQLTGTLRKTTRCHCWICRFDADMCGRARRRGRVRRCGGNVGEYGERRRYNRGRGGRFTSGKPIQPSADTRANILTPVPGIQRCRIAWIRYPCRGLGWVATKPNGWTSEFATTPTAITQKLRTSTGRSDLWHLGYFAVAATGTQHAPPRRSVLCAFCDDA